MAHLLAQKFPLLTEENIENSPSRQDGITATMEARRRRLAANHIFQAAANFNMSVSTCGYAITFFLRFYSRKSMKRNNTFVIAAACLFLASKVNDEPKPHRHLTVELFKCWYGRRHPRLQDAGAGHFLAELYDLVIRAEEAVLFIIGFDFNVDLVYNYMVELLKAPRFGPLRDDVQFQQALVSFCNDVMKKDGTLVLCYPARTLVVAMYYMVLKTPAIRARHEVPLEQGRHWYVSEGVDTPTIEAITQRYLSKLYDTKPAAKRSGGTGAASVATVADSTVVAMPEASALCAASCADGAISAALQNKCQAPTAAHTGSRWVALESTADQLSAGKQAAIAAQREMAEQDSEVGWLPKRARLEPANNQQNYEQEQVQQQRSMVEASDDEKEEGEI